MSDTFFVNGSTEYLLVEIRPTLPGVAIDTTDYPTVELCLAPEGQAFDPATASWEVAAWYEAVGRAFVQGLFGAGALDVAPGRYVAYARLTGVGLSPILRARGAVVVG